MRNEGSYNPKEPSTILLKKKKSPDQFKPHTKNNNKIK